MVFRWLNHRPLVGKEVVKEYGKCLKEKVLRGLPSVIAIG